MNRPGYFLICCILVVAQVLLNNFFNFSQYLVLCYLPAMILFLPVTKGTIFSTVTAFIIGFAVDFFSDGQLGLTTAALVPIGMARVGIVRLVFGQEVFARAENISLARQGSGKVLLGIIFTTAAYLVIYLWLDGAGTRPFWFNLVKFVLSLLLSATVSFFITGLLTYEERGRWR